MVKGETPFRYQFRSKTRAERIAQEWKDAGVKAHVRSRRFRGRTWFAVIIPSMPARSRLFRHFDGKAYKLYGNAPTKSDAMEWAAWVRRTKGIKIRVVKTKRDWRLYSRKRR